MDELQFRRMAVFVSALVYWAGVWVQIARVRRRIGRSPNVRPRGFKERVLWVGWIVVVAVWLGQPWVRGGAASWGGFVPVAGMVGGWSLALGLLLVAAGYAGTLWCYAAMGTAWRMGVNRKERTLLVQHGPYGWVRHPIYAFQVLMLAGAALLLPTPVSLFVLLLHSLCVRSKAADEESYLASVHGDAYAAYRAGTGRLWPRRRRSKPAA